MTVPVCPFNVRSHSPLQTSHSLAVSSSDAVTILLPSGLKQADLTDSVCPFNVRSHAPLAICHSLAVLSADAVTIVLPSGLKQAEVTQWPWCIIGTLELPANTNSGSYFALYVGVDTTTNVPS